MASNKKQIERARRRIEAHSLAVEANKENAGVISNTTSATTTTSEKVYSYDCSGTGSSRSSPESPEEGEGHREVDQETDIYETNPGWLGGLYGWCHTGIVQVFKVCLTFN